MDDDSKCPRCHALHPDEAHLYHCAAVSRVERDATGIAADATALDPARPVSPWQVTDAICRVAQHVGDHIAETAAVNVLIDAGWRP